VPLGFERLGRLGLMYTDLWCRWGRSVLRHGPSGARAFAGRHCGGIPGEKVVSFTPGAVMSRVRYHFFRSRMNTEDHAAEFLRFGSWLATSVAEDLGRRDLDPRRDVFFGFNTNCLEALRLVRSRGVFSVVDQVDPGKVEEDLVHDEMERWPGWERRSQRLPQCYWERLRAEWDLADAVLVNSEWSAEALVRQGVPREKLMVVPLALDCPSDARPPRTAARGRLRVLWLGSVILRKGIPYLVDAARRLQHSDVEFLVAGPVGISKEAVGRFPSNIHLLGRVTRDQLADVYRKADAFVLPTISDGYAITQLEAMSHGLPVIATPNCGRVVTHGHDGLIVPPRDGAAIADAIEMLDAHRDRLADMSRNAARTAAGFDILSNARAINSLVALRKLGREALCS
jgi:glycosyltransferase involved in cell wall biosynthesis